MNNLELYNKVRSVPEEAQKKITGGRLNGMTDINPMWRIKTLTEQFGVCGFGWYTETLGMWIEHGADGEAVANVSIKLYVKMGDEWSQGIFGIGGATIITKESKGLRTDDEAFKKAYTDAISVACKALGIGADVYFAKDKTKYDRYEAENALASHETVKNDNKVVEKTTVPQNANKLVCPVCGQTMRKYIKKDGTEILPEEAMEKVGMCIPCYLKTKKDTKNGG